MATKIIMPQLGESVVEGTVTKWLRQEGETIQEYDALLEVNTDKVDTEIPSAASGTVLKILVPEGKTVNAGTLLAWVGQPGEDLEGAGGEEEGYAHDTTGEQPLAAPSSATQPVAAPAAAPQPVPPPAAAGQPASVQPAGETQPVAVPAAGRHADLGFISPVVAKLARENDLDLARVTGTGAGGRITKSDVLNFVEKGGAAAPTDQAAPPAAELAAWETPGEGDLFRPTELQFGSSAGAPGPSAPSSQPPPPEMPAPAGVPAKTPPQPAQPQAQGGQVLPHSAMRRSIAERMVTNKRTAPHVTTVMEADMSRVAAHRAANKASFAASGVNLTFTAYFLAAAAAALRAFPRVNSSWTDEGVLLHPHINIGVAASLGEEGLIVPVVRGADGLSLLGAARAVNDLAERARARRLQPDEVKGGTFTITNHGVTGSLFATPVINLPQCAILGVGMVQKRVIVLDGDAMAVRPMVYLTLTFDHRILDGASGDGFLAKIVDVLEGWTS